MPTFNGVVEVDDDDIELLEVRHKRRTKENLPESHPFTTLPESRNQSAPSRNHSFEETLDLTHSKDLLRNDTKEETNVTSNLLFDDEVMSDTVDDLTEKDYVELPSLHHVFPEVDRTREPEGNIDRPYYNERDHCEGFVAWWDNKTGKGMIVNYRCSLEHKVEFKDIEISHYGALVPGSMVEYEYSDDEFGKRLSKLWVVSGCEYVL